MENTKLRELAESLDDRQLAHLAREIASVADARRARIDLDEITADRMRDPAFAASVRREIEAAMREPERR